MNAADFNMFDLDPEQRSELFDLLINHLEDFYNRTRELSVTPELDTVVVRQYIRKLNLSKGSQPKEVVEHIIEGMRAFAVHTPHPSYYGLYNPRPNFPSILADLTTAAFNPQMAAWSHHPFANEVEQLLISEMGEKMGYPPGSTRGCFGAGGAEANLTAALCAVANSFPEYLHGGLQSLTEKLVIYCSAESHHSIQRAARVAGLGSDAVRTIAADEQLQIRTEVLAEEVIRDTKDGKTPLMVVGTAGTTGSGSIDNLDALAAICERHHLWFHVDAAYGGAAALIAEGKPWLEGIQRSDSITIDVHKWMSVPMGASMFLTRNSDILGKCFRIDAQYMPKEASALDILDPFSHTIQWSRRFIGLKLYFSLAVFGWAGYERTITHQLNMGRYLKQRLVESDWKIVVDTPLPVVCFTDNINPGRDVTQIHDQVLQSGKAWISIYPIGDQMTLRACITNYSTSKTDIDHLVDLLNKRRSETTKI